MFLVAACCLASCARGLVAPSAPSAWGRPSRLGAAQASEDLALWDEKPDGSSTDVDLAALDDVDALYEAKRRTAAGVAFAERAGYKARDVCLAADKPANTMPPRASVRAKRWEFTLSCDTQPSFASLVCGGQA